MRLVRTVVLAFGAVTQVPVALQQPTFRSTVDLVTVDVFVRRGGKPVTGLRAGDFELFDNGVRQSITAVSSGSAPVDLTFLVDTSGSVEGERLTSMISAIHATTTMLAESDRIRLIAMRHVLNQVVPFQSAAQAVQVNGLVAEGGTCLYDGLVAAMIRQPSPERRRLVMAFTDGGDSSSFIDAATAQAVASVSDSVVVIVALVDRRSGAAAPVRTGDPAGGTPAQIDEVVRRAHGLESENRAQEAFVGESVLRELAYSTGGRLVIAGAKESPTGSFKKLLQEYRQGYVLRYVPNRPTEGWHDISVRVTRQNSDTYDVSARRGYLVEARDR